MRLRLPLIVLTATAVAAVSTSIGPAAADHWWGGYHWAQSGTNPVTVELGDNLNSTWDLHLLVAANGTDVHRGWDNSPVLDTPVLPGKTNPKNCRPTTGRVEVCNASYGKTGWLGIAQIWIASGHIVKGVAKQNDTYFSKPPYNTPAWRQFVLCQEVGHTFGLDHTDEAFDNPNHGTCMDYTSDPDGTAANQLSNEYPNAHDFDQLATIYSGHHVTTSASSTTSTGGDAVGNDASTWGTLVRGADRETTSVFVREHQGGDKTITFVIWAR